ncbi:putative PGG domain-containing protein [Helianthus anomalus]
MANHCMVIDCLITTMVFAVAYTFPGGYRQTEDKYNGFPVFLSKPSFLVFVSADGGSFLLSCASICIFSSIRNFGYPVFRIFRIRISDISDQIFGYG